MQNQEVFASEQNHSKDINEKDGQSGTFRQTLSKNVQQRYQSELVSSHSSHQAHKPRTGKRMREFDSADNDNNNNMTNSSENRNINDDIQESNAQI